MGPPCDKTKDLSFACIDDTDHPGDQSLHCPHEESYGL